MDNITFMKHYRKTIK